MTDSPQPEAWIQLGRDKSVYDPGSTMARLIATHRRIGRVFGPLFYEVMLGTGFLSRPEREMIAAVAAASQDCHY